MPTALWSVQRTAWMCERVRWAGETGKWKQNIYEIIILCKSATNPVSRMPVIRWHTNTPASNSIWSTTHYCDSPGRTALRSQCVTHAYYLINEIPNCPAFKWSIRPSHQPIYSVFDGGPFAFDTDSCLLTHRHLHPHGNAHIAIWNRSASAEATSYLI